MKFDLKGSVCIALLTFASQYVYAVGVSGQGTWETTLQGRDLDGDAATYEAYYDTTLDITWLADANAAGTGMTWAEATTWVESLDVSGVTGWRLPAVSPLNGSTFNTATTSNATSDVGEAPTTTDGTDGGWRDGSGNAVSEMGHMNYVALGNLGICDPTLPPCTLQDGYGLKNTGPFSNIELGNYWTGTELNSSSVFSFGYGNGGQVISPKDLFGFAWAVRLGDVSAVPVPAAVWLFGSGMVALLGVARRKKIRKRGRPFRVKASLQ